MQSTVNRVITNGIYTLLGSAVATIVIKAISDICLRIIKAVSQIFSSSNYTKTINNANILNIKRDS